MKSFLIVGLFIFSINSYACLIESYSYYIRSSTPSTMTVKSSTCGAAVNQRFSSLLSGAEGTISNTRLQEILNKDFSFAKTIVVRPKKIKTETLDSFLNRRLSLKENWPLRNARLSGNKSRSIPYHHEDEIHVVCFRCDALGEKTFRLELKGQGKVFWGNVDIVTRVRSLTAKKNLRANSPFKRKSFTEKIVYTSRPEHFLYPEEKNLEFFKINRTFSKGMTLKLSHLSPLNLIHPHRPVEVVFERKGIHLNGLAMSLQAGKLGDIVQLKNIKNHKIIVGKVVGFDKVNIYP